MDAQYVMTDSEQKAISRSLRRSLTAIGTEYQLQNRTVMLLPSLICVSSTTAVALLSVSVFMG